MPASCNAARRGKLTAEGIASRVALYDSCGIMEMNSAQNTKKLVEHLYPRRVRTIKMAPRVICQANQISCSTAMKSRLCSLWPLDIRRCANPILT